MRNVRGLRKGILGRWPLNRLCVSVAQHSEWKSLEGWRFLSVLSQKSEKNSNCQNIWLKKKFVKMKRFCTVQLLSTLFWREKYYRNVNKKFFSDLGQVHVIGDMKSSLTTSWSRSWVPIWCQPFVHNLCNASISDTLFQMLFYRFVTVLRVVHSDTCGHPLHIGPLFLVSYFVDGIEQPTLPSGCSFFFCHFCGFWLITEELTSFFYEIQPVKEIEYVQKKCFDHEWVNHKKIGTCHSTNCIPKSKQRKKPSNHVDFEGNCSAFPIFLSPKKFKFTKKGFVIVLNLRAKIVSNLSPAKDIRVMKIRPNSYHWTK